MPARTKSEFKLYSAPEIQQIISVSPGEANTLISLACTHSQNYVKNIKTKFYAAQINPSTLLPLTVNEREFDNAYICSPFTRYTTYAMQELSLLKNKALKNLLVVPIKGLRRLLKIARINRVVCVNNWLLSTNLYSKDINGSIEKITSGLTEQFPKHTVMFPSLNRHTNSPLMDQLVKHGYQMIPTRTVYMFDKGLKDYINRRITQTDFDLLETTQYRIIGHHEITKTDYERIVELYNMVYISKYSNCNPQYTPEFITMCHMNEILNFQGLRNKQGVLVGIIASSQRDGVMTTPLIGYDTHLPQKDGIYRTLTALSLREAHDKKLIFNMGAGVAKFKKWRGGVEFTEYCAIYAKHLPFYRRQVWNQLHYLMTYIGIPLVKKYQF